MQWENLTAGEFERAVQHTGVCVVNFSVLEKHAGHLPVGTDLLLGHRLACLAAEQEPAVVFPPYYFGKVFEASCYPGAVAIRPELLLSLAQEIINEIGRNGFRKILLFNSHGGNHHFLHFLVQCSLHEQKPYSLYLMPGIVTPDREQELTRIFPGSKFEHAGEIETSLAYALFPELVQENALPTDGGEPLSRRDGTANLVTGIDWYSKFPEHYAGDARKASLKKGERLVRLIVDSIANHIAAVKNDETVPDLTSEFFARADRLKDRGKQPEGEIGPCP